MACIDFRDSRPIDVHDFLYSHLDIIPSGTKWFIFRRDRSDILNVGTIKEGESIWHYFSSVAPWLGENTLYILEVSNKLFCDVMHIKKDTVDTIKDFLEKEIK